MRKFDTKVQLLKYKVLREVARIAFDEGEFSLANNFNDIAKTVTSDKATMRCCIYKERAIVAERIKARLRRQQSKSEHNRGYRYSLRRMSCQRLSGITRLPWLYRTPL